MKLHVFTDLTSYPDHDQINFVNTSASKTPPASIIASSFFDEESNTINNEFTSQMANLREKLKTFNTTTVDDSIKTTEDDHPVEIRDRVTNESAEKRQSTSRSRRDSPRFKSGFINAIDIEMAMGSMKTEDEIEVVNEIKEIPPLLPSSVPPPFSMIHKNEDENPAELHLPWHKKHEYRPISKTFLDDLDKVSFKPIDVVTSSSENLSKLSKPSDFYPSREEKNLSKSTDDLIHPDVDGLRKTVRSIKNKSKKNKIYSSTNSLLQMDESLYENLNTKSMSDLTESLEKEISFKKPQPLPRVNSLKDISEQNRNSKTLTFVLDKDKDEFVLEENIEPQCSTVKRPSFVFNTFLSTKKSSDENIYETMERYIRPERRAPPPPQPTPTPQSEIISIQTPNIRNKPIHDDSDYFQPIEKLDFKINTIEAMPTTNERRSGFFRLNRKKKEKEKDDFNRSTFYGDVTDFEQTEIVHYRSNENLSKINPPRMSTFKNYKVAVDFNDCLDSEDDRKIIFMCISLSAFFLICFFFCGCHHHLCCSSLYSFFFVFFF